MQNNRTLFLYSIFLFFSYSFCSEYINITALNQEPLKSFFPIDDAYKHIITIVSNTNEDNYEFANTLHTNVKKLLLACQNKTYGFCYWGMIENASNPKLALINHQYPYYLNLELYCLRQPSNDDNDNIIMLSKNIDFTFYPGLTKKRQSYKKTSSFWQTSYYYTRIDEDFNESYSSFWGPFFDKDGNACCFFYTNISSACATTNDFSSYSLKNYLAYAILYHCINKDGVKYHYPCYISHSKSTYAPLYPLHGDNDKYFLLLLAAFFPSKEIKERKIFFTHTYNIKELNSLKAYLNTIRNSQPNLPQRLEKHVQNSATYILLLHFLKQTKESFENKNFYKEINCKINALIKQKTPATQMDTE